ncbi:MAG: hypothetical protein Q9195_006527 [Heterodermia aff. obscurata]
MDTLGLTNACVDLLVSTASYPAYAHNNTYDLQLFSDSRYEEASYNLNKPGGCLDLIRTCRSLGQQSDSGWSAANDTVNGACTLATQYCFANVDSDLDTLSNRSNFDIATTIPDPCPFYAPAVTFLNQPWVQRALGVPLNFTIVSNVVAALFGPPVNPAGNTIPGTGDASRRSIAELEYALQHDLKVAMVFGDRDYRCNWLGGEATALAAQWSHSQQFQQSGYARVRSNETYSGATVKQYDRLSFSRVFDAGHSVSAYQPETVYRIFMRSMFDRDIATGTQSREGHTSSGPLRSDGIRNVLPPAPSTCMVEGRYQDVAVALS